MNNQRAFDGQTKGLIKRLHKRGWTYKRLAAKFYCCINTIKRYCTQY